MDKQFTSNYESRVVIYERQMFIRLATGPSSIPKKGMHSLSTATANVHDSTQSQCF